MAWKNEITIKLLPIALLATLVFAGCVFASDAPNAAAGVGIPRSLGWEMLTMVALAAVAALLAIGYMAGKFMNDDRLLAWVKKELGQLVVSALIFALAIAVANSSNDWMRIITTISSEPAWSSYVDNVVCSSTNGATSSLGIVTHRACHVEVANDYLQLLYETLRMSAASYLNSYWIYGFLANLSVSVTFISNELSPGLGTAPFAGLSMTADFFSILFDMAIKGMMLVRFQQIFLDYVSYAFFPLFLSLGVLLRAFYFTRKLGGLLIAIALSTYLVFPMFYVACDGILFSFMGGWTTAGWKPFGSSYNADPNTGTPMPLAEPNSAPDYGTSADSKKALADSYSKGKTVNIDFCGDGGGDNMESAANGFAEKWGTGVYEHSPWYSQAIRFVTGGEYIPPFGAFDTKGPIATMAQVLVFTLALPFFGLMATLASIKAFSPLIGGDVEISVLSRLI